MSVLQDEEEQEAAVGHLMAEWEVAMQQGSADKASGRHSGEELLPCADETQRAKIEAGRPSLGKRAAVFGRNAGQGTNGSKRIEVEEGSSSVCMEID